ncbi:glutaminase kidney isoform, mitochondrial-like isoform X2 [Antedon mediterranea]|uniref:glutaminase kidney isoform, mitochondrial-like isoform X2 n=1 Tax=Antedon mediterranea TaxID=105859 RepID=UPI003AF5BC88
MNLQHMCRPMGARMMSSMFWKHTAGRGPRSRRCYLESNLISRPSCYLRFIFSSSSVMTNIPSQPPVLLECLEDKIFDICSDDKNTLLIGDFFKLLKEKGLHLEDPRLQESITKFNKVAKDQNLHHNTCYIDKEEFKNCITDNIVLIGKALTNKFIIPEFKDFSEHLSTIYEDANGNSSGKVATYIPQLSRQDPAHWGVSVCTIDGQRHNIGNTSLPFCLQSCCKAPAYALTVTKKGSDYVHQHVGFEPSGKPFNELVLNTQNKPHNPLLNSGGILISAIMKSDWSPADTFDFTSKQFSRLTGGEFIGFSNAVFLSEKETAFRNRAIAYLMKEYNALPDDSSVDEILDFYFQLCSIEVTCESGSVIAATLANGGVCPTTGERVLDPAAVRDTLTIMSSCGMYDYSGQFAFQIGLPAKSGVSGGILVVVPNVMGMMLWSPPLDSYGNSVRGIHFLKDLVRINSFHNFDNLRHTTKKIDPRKSGVGSKGSRIVNLLFGAYNNDLSAMRQYALQGMNMDQADYDLRTALHIAAAEGHKDIVQFLLEKCNVDPCPKDRWGFTPLHEAKQCGHDHVVTILEKYTTK